jgi:hypothetical protein
MPGLLLRFLNGDDAACSPSPSAVLSAFPVVDGNILGQIWIYLE